MNGNKVLLAYLGIDNVKLSRLCSQSRGCFLFWLIRQIYREAYHSLSTADDAFLRELAVDLYRGKPIYALAKSDALLKGQLLLPTDHLHRLAVVVSRSNPYGATL